MTGGILLDAITNHLNALESIYKWAVLVALAVAWAGIRRQQKIKIFDIEIERRQSFYALAALFLLANVTVLVLFIRLGELMSAVGDADFLDGFTRLSTHPWILNPFAYFGDSRWAGLVSSEGFGLLVVIWWLCFSGLHALLDDSHARYVRFLLGAFLFTGLLTMLAIHRVAWIVVDRLHNLHSRLYLDVVGTGWERLVGILLGLCVGLFVFNRTRRLQAAT
jgi:hypothetical protein